MNRLEQTGISSACDMICAGNVEKMELPKSSLASTHKAIKAYKVPSKNPKKYTVRVDIQVEED